MSQASQRRDMDMSYTSYHLGKEGVDTIREDVTRINVTSGHGSLRWW